MISGRIPIKTHIVTDKDDIVEVAKKYAGEITSPGDIIAVAESVVAISQGRAILPETVKPGLLARILCHFPGKEGSLAAPPSIQVAIRETGLPRFLLGVAAAGLGRLVGRRGDFYRVAGRHLAQIDDFAGTMWPFDRHIVLGPKDPQKVVDRIKQATGAEAVITDVNDLGKVDILAATDGVAREMLFDYLKDNPHGNDDQQTPIVVLISEQNMRNFA
ncbi:coenzyme F420-0:L-glutamate ligase [Pelotomaculum terephthalicicum JT]|uniref:coenzyme F420-0:L-glutamate ligase n=1 Tax=Pelotomaculum TaxID=191373 RepID=UPI0009CD2E3F|nr:MULTISPECIES: coenzyme F420-0:L-glutamate ligase [Pelotomaculum]MCG9967087.1 coenzyme F420-0:L-glutamate ligase [Pelotomaculum terephthalicicum JT]OPX89275.1 MAG: F420-0:Gamma-glutamyl ligase [Pelotomaculum sp. PtaB.Bin117]OPY63867.1 MAG: F420-0:Gamma-glutamyl ligase [Pelotomaculum sp. PtaU1.Bin065]